MSRFGIALMLAGASLILGCWLWDTSIPVGDPYLRRVTNISLNEMRLVVALTGLASFVGGAVLLAGGQIVAAVGRLQRSGLFPAVPAAQPGEAEEATRGGGSALSEMTFGLAPVSFSEEDKRAAKAEMGIRD